MMGAIEALLLAYKFVVVYGPKNGLSISF